MSVEQILTRKGPRRLLALDGGGVRGIISLEILARIEAVLREQSGNPNLVLADYFDYFGGTSTGAIIGTFLALGKSVDEIRKFYIESTREMFALAGIMHRWRNKFSAKNLTETLRREIGPATTLGDASVRTLLMLVLRNATTDSPWPISNNPQAHYNERNQPSCNLNFPLWQLVRASTAAPTFFPPEVIEVNGQNFVFIDGGVTTYNNPAFQLFLMATATPYRLAWPTGEDQILLVSVGTGSAANANANLKPNELNFLYHVKSLPSALIGASQNQQDFLCRIFGKCLFGSNLDHEAGDLLDGVNHEGEVSARIPSFQGLDGPAAKLFSYLRYNADLSPTGLEKLGFRDIPARQILRMECPGNVANLRRIGEAVAERQVRGEVFARFKPNHWST